MFETNSIIRASAGTGKTFSLATRFIRLMILDGVKPETIVALTFSRAAAQEIYTKILGRLCAAAADERGAASEWENLLEDYRKGRVRDGEAKLAAIGKNPPPHAARDFATLLRRLVDTQHLGAIATLDSFILKIVRNFPKEMGFQNAVSVLDPVDEDAAVDDAVRSALSRTDGSSQAVAEAFVASQKGECVRQCLGAIAAILNGQGWRNFVIAHPESRAWTVADMARALGVNPRSACPDLSMIPFNDMGRKGCESCEETFVKWARAYDGAKSPFETKEKVVELMKHFWENPEATSFAYTFYRRPYTVDCGAEGAAAIRAAIRHMSDVYLMRQLEVVAAKIRLVSAVEAEYDRTTRLQGKLTFSDFTKFSAENEFSKSGIALRNVEYRFDAKFDHWALDEFQDTSELQWACLKALVENAAESGYQDEGRTAMAVGDMKQSIYTWRGASARPFEEIASWPAFQGFDRDLSDSHRYGPNIAAFVNRIFGLGNIRTGDVIPAACEGAVEAWRKGWRDHVSNEAPDYVKVVAASADEDDEEDDEMLPALHAEIAALWERHRAARSRETVAVLVRGNDMGLKVAEYLRSKGMDVVWEGLNPCADDPVVQSVLSLLRLADHPSDSAAWQTASRLIDIRTLLLPGCESCASASERVSRLLTQQGLARTLKDWTGVLRGSGRLAKGGLTEAKLRRLVELAVTFAERDASDDGMLAFADYVAKSGQREIASSPDVIRVLTIHRSKGLGIDHVFVPLFEAKRSSSAIDMPKGGAPLFDGGGWVLPHLAKGSEALNAQTQLAFARMRGARFAESLRTYYVALTRAKKSLFVVFPEDRGEPDAGKGLLMRDLIRRAVGSSHEAGVPPSFKADGKTVGAPERAPWAPVGVRQTVERSSPSRGGASGGPSDAAQLFDEDYGRAAQRGTDAHETYAAIDWVDPAAPKDGREEKILGSGFRAAFVKPSPSASVWRERAYELFDGGVWESGRFDRVVFTGEGAARSATVYDFKTNARREGEDDEAMSARLRRLYASQMEAYRRALSRLTGIPRERVAAALLLEATGRVCRF